MPVFSRTMCTLLFVGSVTAALPAAAVPAPHREAAMSAARSGLPAFHLAARKGTRNFRADDADAPGAPSTSTTPASPDKPADAAAAANPDDTHSLENCMATWDKGTHISKSRWREICQRNANDRGQTEAGAAR
jgi:hypothetical protein